MSKGENTTSKRVTTSIKVDPELWKDVKIYCIKNNNEISEFVEKCLREKIK